MGSHINADGEFQSDKYPSCPPGKVPLSVRDPMAQDLLWQYALRRADVDRNFSEDLLTALISAGYRDRRRWRYASFEPAVLGLMTTSCLFASAVVLRANLVLGVGYAVTGFAWATLAIFAIRRRMRRWPLERR